MDEDERRIDRLIGERLRRRRTELGMTQEQLAAALDCSYQQVQKYENGTNRISASRLAQVARRLAVPVGHFFTGGEKDTATVDAAAALEALGQGGRPSVALELVKSFSEIDSHEVRQALAALARTVAERAEPEQGRGGGR